MGDGARRVLVVDDDDGVRTVAAWQLQAEGFVVSQARDGAEALERIAREDLQLVILDLSLPVVAGLDVLRRLRTGATAARTLPVIVLSGRNGETDRIIGLDLGADDYLVKPFSPGELAARVRSVLRRSRVPVPDDRDRGGDAPGGSLRVDEVTRDVTALGRAVDLTAKEFDLLAFLVRHPRQVFTRAQLLHRVWGTASQWQSEATVTEHVHRLRQKIEPDPAHPRWLRTVRGVGYRLEPQ